MALSAEHVGSRVVIRVTVAGETGPSGGPALRDILGILTEWGPSHVSVRRRDGVVETVRRGDIVTGKPIPPRASIRQRIPPGELQRVCARGWLPPDTAELGDWLLRAAGGFTGRANSALVDGDPGKPVDDALAELAAFYGARQLPPMAQVVVGSPDSELLAARGWVRARPQQPDAIVQVASVAIARRRRSSDPAPPGVDLQDEPSDAWIDRYGRTQGVDPAVVRQVLLSGDDVAFAQIGDPIVAIGRGVIAGDWVGLSAVEVDPARRREGLGSAVVAALLEWAASLGARSAYLQALPDNVAALAMYEPFGFATHHAYRYLRPPD
jgi:GNAT superfamily N-acetyltransferase